MESDQYMEQQKMTPYEDLTLEQKADFIAECLDFGWNDYFDRCKKLDDGRYEYYCADAEETTICTAAELVEGAEEHDKADIIAMWEDKNA